MAFNSIFSNTFNKIFIMKTVKINNHELKLYDSIDEMPIVNFQKYNKYYEPKWLKCQENYCRFWIRK